MHQADARMPRPAFVAALTVVIVFVGSAALGSWLVLRAGHVQVGTPEPQHVGPIAIEGIYQTPIEGDGVGLQQHRRDKDRLSTYGWVDQPRGIVHIPIARAMEIVAQEHP